MQPFVIFVNTQCENYSCAILINLLHKGNFLAHLGRPNSTCYFIEERLIYRS